MSQQTEVSYSSFFSSSCTELRPPSNWLPNTLTLKIGTSRCVQTWRRVLYRRVTAIYNSPLRGTLNAEERLLLITYCTEQHIHLAHLGINKRQTSMACKRQEVTSDIRALYLRKYSVSVEQNVLWGSYISDIPHVSWESKFHYRLHESLLGYLSWDELFQNSS
jgi:hypothetical protein